MQLPGGNIRENRSPPPAPFRGDLRPNVHRRGEALPAALAPHPIPCRCELAKLRACLTRSPNSPNRKLVAIAHAEHRQVFDQLAVVLRTPPDAAGYQQEWESFVTVLDAHADEEERDLCPPPVEMSEDELDELGDQMRQGMAELRDSTIEKLHMKGRTALLRTF